jgi:hypothetical protein
MGVGFAHGDRHEHDPHQIPASLVVGRAPDRGGHRDLEHQTRLQLTASLEQSAGTAGDRC